MKSSHAIFASIHFPSNLFCSRSPYLSRFTPVHLNISLDIAQAESQSKRRGALSPVNGDRGLHFEGVIADREARVNSENTASYDFPASTSRDKFISLGVDAWKTTISSS